MSTLFNFSNKENATHLSKPAPKTPSSNKSIIFKNNNNNNNNNNSKKINVLKDEFKTPNNKVDVKKRVPLGGKDKNANGGILGAKLGAGSLNDNHFHRDALSSSAAKRRIRRLKTPMTNRPLSKKLNVLRDDDSVETEIEAPVALEFDDDEIEYVPEKQPELPFEPLNYDPFTEEELNSYKNAYNPRTFDCREDVVQLTEEEIHEEYPLNFDEEDNESDTHSIISMEKNKHPHFMEPTFVSSARSKSQKKIEIYDEGLSSNELQRIIDDDN